MGSTRTYRLPPLWPSQDLIKHESREDSPWPWGSGASCHTAGSEEDRGPPPLLVGAHSAPDPPTLGVRSHTLLESNRPWFRSHVCFAASPYPIPTGPLPRLSGETRDCKLQHPQQPGGQPYCEKHVRGRQVWGALWQAGGCMPLLRGTVAPRPGQSVPYGGDGLV